MYGRIKKVALEILWQTDSLSGPNFAFANWRTSPLMNFLRISVIKIRTKEYCFLLPKRISRSSLHVKGIWDLKWPRLKSAIFLAAYACEGWTMVWIRFSLKWCYWFIVPFLTITLAGNCLERDLSTVWASLENPSTRKAKWFLELLGTSWQTQNTLKRLNKIHCYIAGVFLAKARPFIG